MVFPIMSQADETSEGVMQGQKVYLVPENRENMCADNVQFIHRVSVSLLENNTREIEKQQILNRYKIYFYTAQKQPEGNFLRMLSVSKLGLVSSFRTVHFNSY